MSFLAPSLNALFLRCALFAASLFLLQSDSHGFDDPVLAKRIDFNEDIRSILSDNCFLCHGPAEETREADLRLDQFDFAVADGAAIVPHDASASEVIARITCDDLDLVMPPPETGKTLSPDQVNLLKQWVDQGAEYEEHWAFETPVRPDVPDLKSSWPRNAIDHFVLSKLNENGLPPSPEATQRQLLKRLSLDLKGLPPTSAAMNAIASSTANQGRSGFTLNQFTEAALNSSSFAEHWARWWLDAARYADSDGYEKDKPREVWFYRDWVIHAMNSNMPYDQFVIQQIAGDLLPNASQSQIVATGFLRNSMINEEGGADPEQFRVEGMFDRMDAIGKSMLGLTTQCAQCHTHKYDPLSHSEYYQMFAALNDFHEAIMTVYTPDEMNLRANLLSSIEGLNQSLKTANPDWQKRMGAWQQHVLESGPEWRVLVPTDRPFEGQKFRPLPDGSIISESYAPTKSSSTFKLTTNLEGVTAFRLEALTHPQLPHNGPGRSLLGTGAVTEFEVDVASAADPSKKTKLKFVKASATVNPEESKLLPMYRDRKPEKDDRITGPIQFAIDGNQKTAWTTDIGPGRRNVDHQAVFVLDKPVDLQGDVVVSIRPMMNHGGWNSDDNQNYLLGRYRFSVTKSDDADTDVIPESVRNVLAIPSNRRSAEEQKIAFGCWVSLQPEFAEFHQQIDELWKQHPEGHSQLVAQALPKPRKSFVYARGDFLSPTEQVTAGVPAVLGRLPDSHDPDRLKFAKWIVSKQNPTAARAIVNRIWQAYFGLGLVETPEDLGYQSAPPSHPDLLDWLAVELMDHDWDLKHIHRLIVSSATYRQSSSVSKKLQELDPYNRLLARGSRFRVNAEVVRDLALSVSGLLNDSVGGPSVYPETPMFLFQPPASYGPKIWATSTGDDAFRRSIYVHAYRSVPYPPLQMFDAPKADASCVRRGRSNTPLQALTVLNEAQFVECARVFAGRILRDVTESDERRIAYAFELCTCREPTPNEVSVLLKLLQESRKRIALGELQAEAMMATHVADHAAVDDGDSVGGDADADDPDDGDPVGRDPDGGDAEQSLREIAAWFTVARALLNLDETITRE
ncbi:MAG: PSD1 and planctomycete cytochrome C domain-containing protein [Fuerstiella sp.]